MIKRKPIPEDIKEWFGYIPDSGVFFIKKRHPKNTSKKDVIVHRCKKRNYGYIGFNKKLYFAHRVAWFMFYSEQPPYLIDHINGDCFDNKIKNLRAATDRENQNNQKIHRNGRLPGCTFDKRKNKWQAKYTSKGKHYHIGLFKTEKEAHLAYLAKSKEPQI